ncbi:MAG TPA: ADOP family duplicated permease [Lacunisphaera sp.]|jgi:predicted permease|nr:ADOP family duplicated permease [Lacunisphaera sp.]
MDLLSSAFRSLRAHAAFSALIILLLGLGIGANTAIFSVVDAVLLKPLPYPASGELVLARKPPRDPAMMQIGGGDAMPDNEFRGWVEAQPKAFRTLAAYRNNPVTLQLGDGAVRAPGAAVTGSFFPMLGVSAWRGRLFAAADLQANAPLTTIISYTAWQSRFQGDENVLGRVVRIDDQPHTIIGVLPPSFEFIEPAQFWQPLQIQSNAPGQLRIQMIRAFGRLLPGTNRDSAQRELDEISTRFWDNLMAGFGGPRPEGAAGPSRRVNMRLPFADAKVQLVPLQEQLVKQSRATLWLLLGAVGFVLLIACANIANLQLARTAGRRREAAIRAALGASPARLALELLLENILLALAGGAFGVLLAMWCTHALQSWLADYLPRINPIGVDGTVLGFAALLAAAAGLAFGLAPAWQGCRVDLLDPLKDGGHQASAGGQRWRQALVALEVALALVLAVNAGLLVKGIYTLYTTDLGYRTADVMTANLALPRRYGTPVEQREFSRRWLEELATLPGVKVAALADVPPLSPYAQVMLVAKSQGSSGNANATVNAQPPSMAVASVTPDFFRATGIALRQGRLFNARDGADAPRVALVNEAFIKQYYPQGLTLGAELTAPGGGHGGPPLTAAIVGVVADVRARGFDSVAQPLAYFPLEQSPAARISAVLQFEGGGAALARALTVATHKVDADLAFDQPSTLADQLAKQTAPRRVTLILTGCFAATAVLLAALGIFGVMSYTVTQRRKEIGVRMALGADAPMILRWILRHGGLAIGAGLLVGSALTLATSRLLASVLTGMTTLDPMVLAVAVAALGAIALLACLLPARRATKVNPVEALRAE